VLIGGGNGSGNGSAMDGLLGLKLMEMMDPIKKDDSNKEIISPVKIEAKPKKSEE
jgi:hypothetical protein